MPVKMLITLLFCLTVFCLCFCFKKVHLERKSKKKSHKPEKPDLMSTDQGRIQELLVGGITTLPSFPPLPPPFPSSLFLPSLLPTPPPLLPSFPFLPLPFLPYPRVKRTPSLAALDAASPPPSPIFFLPPPLPPLYSPLSHPSLPFPYPSPPYLPALDAPLPWPR
jgi:hypothetical protein